MQNSDHIFGYTWSLTYYHALRLTCQVGKDFYMFTAVYGLPNECEQEQRKI
jgi:hypothetical protein